MGEKLFSLYESKDIKLNIFFFSQQLTLEHARTLKMEEDVLGVKFSPDQRLIAVSLLDNTIKVFFTDTLKVCQALNMLDSFMYCTPPQFLSN